MRRFIARFLSDRAGATAIEYGLIAALVFLIMLSGFTLFAGTSTGAFKIAFGKLSTALEQLRD